MHEGERVVILVVQDEEAFAELLQHFPMDQYNLMFATDPAEALALCEMRAPRLIVVPTSFAGGGLADVLVEVRPEDALILGVAQTPEEVEAAENAETDGETIDLFDQVVCVTDAEKLASAARELLNERRTRPRINLEFPIQLGEKAQGIVREFSAASLRVETSEALRTGTTINVTIGWGPKPLTFEAVVGRVHETLFFGQKAVILHIHENEERAKEYLDELVRRVVELQYILAGNEDQPGKLRGTSAWELTRRAEETLRDSKGLRIRESGELAVDDDETEELDVADLVSVEVPLEGRYELGDAVAVWGVGDIFKATHKLLDRPVTLKRLRAELRDDENARLRLELEARVSASFAGKNIVDVIDFGADGHGGLYYAMEALKGETLAEALANGQEFTPVEVASMGIHLTYALARLHLRGGGHYDLCPENIFLRRSAGTTVTPILINIAGPEAWSLPPPQHALGVDLRPPKASESAPNPSCDIYALAKVLQVALSTSLPSSPEHTPGEEDLEAVLSLGCAKDRSDRLEDAQTFRESLMRSLSLLETEPAAELATNVAQPPTIGRPRPSQLGSIPPPDLSDSYLERVVALEVSRRSTVPPPYAPYAPLRGRTRQSSVAGANPAAPSPPLPPIPPPPIPPEQLVKPELAPSSGVVVPTLEDVYNDANRQAETAPEASPPPEAVSGLTTQPAGAPEVVPGPTTRPVAAPQTVNAQLEELPESLEAAPSPSRRGPMIVAIAALVVAIGTGTALAFIWQPWAQDDDEQLAGVGSGATPDHDPRPQKIAAHRDAGTVSRTRDAAHQVKAPEPSDAGAAQPANEADGSEPHPETPSDGGASSDDSNKSPSERRRELVGKAKRRIRHGLYRDATDLLNEAAYIRNGADIQVLLAQAYERQGRTRSAIYYMKKAIAYSPSNARRYDSLGSLYVKNGERTRACEAFRQSLRLNAKLSSAQRHFDHYCMR